LIVHAFITRRDEWILPRHLAAYSSFCDRIVAVIDRSPTSAAICRDFPKVRAITWHGPDLPDFNEHGTLADEGAMRQAAWDAAMQYRPSLVVFGDTDEIPTPDIADWLAADGGPDPAVEHWYADWVNLWGDERHAIGGQNCAWSFQKPTNNKKGLVTRPIPGKAYRYWINQQHVRMEPSPVYEGTTRIDERHRIGPVKLVHYRYASEQWRSNPMRHLRRFQTMADGAEIVDVPSEWIWPAPPAPPAPIPT
jgi:hypothetical protein